ncbi:MAG: Hsp20/alpha crystallin family protein [Acidobacteriota bacterium]
MQLVRWDPFRDLRFLHRRMDRLFNEALSGYPDSAEGEPITASWVPAVDIYEGDAAITLRAELPGLSEDDVEVTLEDGRLTVKGEKKLEQEEKEGEYRRIESRYGAFYRSFPLPNTVDKEQIKARFDNGVLEVSLPKAEAAKPKRIAVSNN